MPAAIVAVPLRAVPGLTDTLCVAIGGWGGGGAPESFTFKYNDPTGAADYYLPPPNKCDTPQDVTPTVPRFIQCHIERTGAAPAAYTGAPPTVDVWYDSSSPANAIANSRISVTVPASFPTDARVILTVRYYPSPVGR